MRRTRLLAALAALAVGAAVTGANVAAAPSATMKVSAALTAKAEVPIQVVKNTKGSGSFTGTLTGSKLVWKLTFTHLSGAATAAHIHLGKTGKAGNVVVPLCAGAKCTSGVHGSATLTAAVLKALTTGGTYVNVHTAKNPNGEIRGQISP
jgi:hypothetical protein